MAHIHVIPIDAWVVILRFINKHDLVHTYNILFRSRAINVPIWEKLNTFWIVVSQSRMLDSCTEFDDIPNIYETKSVFAKLKDMGLHEDRASEIIRSVNGNVYQVFDDFTVW